MKTIMHVIDSTEPGGAETVFVQLADELRARGYRSIVAVSGPGWVTEELHRRSFEPVIIDAKGAFNWRLVKALLRIVREEKVDLIQSHLLGSNVYCALVGLIARKPVIATFHGMVDVSPDERLRWLKFQIMKYGVSRFVAVSQRLRDAIAGEGLLSPQKTAIIYNGIDFSRYAKSTRRELRRLLRVDDTAVLIGSLGNLHPAKGYDHLVRSAAAVVARYPAAHFVIAGEIKPHLIGGLEALMEANGVSGHVHFIGFVNDSAEYLAQLDVFLLPSVSEGFSIATIEAMATGLPTVVTRCGGPEEIVSAGVDAVMIEPANAEAISAALLALLAAPALRDELGRRARSSVVQRFDKNNMINAYLELYGQVHFDH